MTTSSQGALVPDHTMRLTALKLLRDEVLSFCAGLNQDQWRTASLAPGWTIQDVVAHLGSSCHALFTPTALTILRSDEIERTNDRFVSDRRGWAPERTLHEYGTWSRRLTTLVRILALAPIQRLPVRMAELGKFPAGVLIPGAFVFDHHTHLRFDMAPALHTDLGDPEPQQLAVVLEWMTAVLNNQVRSGGLVGLAAPLNLVLHGPGGGTWTLAKNGVTRGATEHAVATVTGQSTEFPEWGTRRAPWTKRDVEVQGDLGYAAAILDQVNVI